nr:baseplate J/gp47 family protein [Eubacteriales bacterium]
MGVYDNQTYINILNRALARVSNAVDKREGSIIYDALAPACYELAELYIELQNLINMTYATTATGAYLDLRVGELGIVRRSAVNAVRVGEFNVAVPLGSRFSISGINYTVQAFVVGHYYSMICETPGSIGNTYAGTLTPISYISGLTSAILTDIPTDWVGYEGVVVLGVDEETDPDLRARYLLALQAAPFGG